MGLDGDLRESSETERFWVLWLGNFKDENVGNIHSLTQTQGP